MKKIPVKIIEFSDGDRMVQEVMIDLIDTMQLEGDPGEQIEDFRNSYFDFVKKVKTLFYGSEQSKKKKRQTLPSSVYYRVGELFQNNHHKHGARISFAHRWFEVDPTYLVLRFFKLLGIIKFSTPKNMLHVGLTHEGELEMESGLAQA